MERGLDITQKDEPSVECGSWMELWLVSRAEELRVFPVGGGNKEMLGDEKGGLWPI